MFLVNRERRVSIYAAGLAGREGEEGTYARVDGLRVISSKSSLEAIGIKNSDDTASLLMFKTSLLMPSFLAFASRWSKSRSLSRFSYGRILWIHCEVTLHAVSSCSLAISKMNCN